jgi:hypothetical protein
MCASCPANPIFLFFMIHVDIILLYYVFPVVPFLPILF